MSLDRAYTVNPTDEAEAEVHKLVTDFLEAYAAVEDKLVPEPIRRMEGEHQKRTRNLAGIVAHILNASLGEGGDLERQRSTLQGIGFGVGATLVDTPIEIAFSVAASVGAAVMAGRDCYIDAKNGGPTAGEA